MPKGFSKNGINNGQFQKVHSLEDRFGAGQINTFKGKKHTKESKELIGLAQIGHEPWNKGENWPERSGINHPLWKGGKSVHTRGRYAPRPKPEQCEICGAFGKDFKKGLCYDHDHLTGEFRGWLCTRCNLVLGFVKDNPDTLKALSDYLIKNRKI